jgi:hypothetical protein
MDLFRGNMIFSPDFSAETNIERNSSFVGKVSGRNRILVERQPGKSMR